MTRVLNKLNSLMEISDTQAALALLGMGPTVCSETFSYYDLRSTKNFVLDQYFGRCNNLNDVGIRLDGVDDADWIGDEDSFSSASVHSDDGDEEMDVVDSFDSMDVDNDDSCNEMCQGSQNGGGHMVIQNR
jgi:hypothetical protein